MSRKRKRGVLLAIIALEMYPIMALRELESRHPAKGAQPERSNSADDLTEDQLPESVDALMESLCKGVQETVQGDYPLMQYEVF